MLTYIKNIDTLKTDKGYIIHAQLQEKPLKVEHWHPIQKSVIFPG